MSDGPAAEDYSADDTFSPGGRTSVAAAEELLIVGDDTGQFDIVTAGGQNRVRTDDSVVDVAAGRYPLVLGDETVAAFTGSGIELWQRDVADAAHIAAPGDGTPVHVLTTGGDIVGLDPETGSERFRRGRPHDDISDVSAVVGAHGRLAVGAWSFLSVVTETGDVILDHSFDGVVSDVGLSADLAVASLKDGRLVGLDLETGEERWRIDDGVETVTSAGNRVVAALSDGLATVDETGQRTALGVPSANTVAATADLTVVATVTNGSVTVYRPVTDPIEAISAFVRTERAQPGEPVRVVFENEGTQARSFTPDIEFGAKAKVGSRSRPLDIEPGARSEVAVDVTSVEDPGDTTVTVSVDGEPLTTGEVYFEAPSDPVEQISTTSSLLVVSDGELRWRTVVENTGSTAVDMTASDESTRLAPGEEVERTFQDPYEAGARRERPVTVTTAASSDTVTVGVDAPRDVLSIAIEQDRTGSQSYVDVELSNESEVPVQESVSITVDGSLTRERVYELSPGSTTVVALALPQTPAGEFSVIATCQGTGTSERCQLAGWPDRVTSGQQERASRGTDKANSDETTTRPPANTDQPRSEDRASDESEQTDDWFERGQSESNGEWPTDDSTTAESAPQKPTVTVDRSLPESVPVGAAVSEYVTITVEDAQLGAVTVEVADDAISVPAIDTGETAAVKRPHVFTEPGKQSVTGGTVSTPVGDYDLPDATVTVTRGDLHPQFLVEQGIEEASVAIEVANETGQPCRLDVFGLDLDEETWEQFDVSDGELPSGGATTIERSLPGSRVPSVETLDAGIKYHSADGGKEYCHTLAVIRDAPGPEFSVEVGEGRGVAAGTNGAIPVSVTNESGQTVTDVSVDATGPAVENSSLYSAVDVGTLQPGETIDGVNVDIKPERSGTCSLSVTVSGSAGSNAVERSVRLSGPVATDRESAPQGLDAWSTNAERDNEDPPYPTHIHTGYESADPPDS